MKADAERWDERYRTADFAPDAVAPDAVAASGLLDVLPRTGRALDVACGLGAQSRWLAQRGLAVTAIDVSSEAVSRTVAANASLGLEDRIDVVVHDLDIGIPIEWGSFDVIVCQRFRSRGLYDDFVTRLSDCGVAIITVLSESGAENPGPFHAPPGELASAFARHDVDIVFHSEARGEESVIVRRPQPS